MLLRRFQMAHDSVPTSSPFLPAMHIRVDHELGATLFSPDLQAMPTSVDFLFLQGLDIRFGIVRVSECQCDTVQIFREGGCDCVGEGYEIDLHRIVPMAVADLITIMRNVQKCDRMLSTYYCRRTEIDGSLA